MRGCSPRAKAAETHAPCSGLYVPVLDDRKRPSYIAAGAGDSAPIARLRHCVFKRLGKCMARPFRPCRHRRDGAPAGTARSSTGWWGAIAMAEDESTRSGKPLRVRDARGRVVPMLDPYLLHLIGRHTQIETETLGSIAHEVGPGVKRRGYLWFWFLPVLVVAMFVFLIVRKFIIGVGLTFDAVERVLWPLNTILLALAVHKMWQNMRHGRRARILEVMLRRRRCPHCGYDLRLLPVDEADRATVCPECGCAWLLPPEGNPTRTPTPRCPAPNDPLD